MDHKLACDAMKEYAETRLHCSVSIKNLSSISLRGFYLRGENKLVLSDKLNDTQRLSSGLHELSHGNPAPFPRRITEKHGAKRI